MADDYELRKNNRKQFLNRARWKTQDATSE